MIGFCKNKKPGRNDPPPSSGHSRGVHYSQMALDSQGNPEVARDSDGGWKLLKAAHGEAVPFSFEVRGKMRHTNSHDVKVHQLIVKVWSLSSLKVSCRV